MKSLLLSVAIATFAFGCTKQREASFPDGGDTDLYELSELQNKIVALETGAPAAAKSQEDRFRAGTGSELAIVKDSNASERIAPVFKDLRLSAGSDASIEVQFKIDQENLTAYRVAGASDALSEIDAGIAIQETAKNGVARRLVPIFQLPVQGMGKVVRAKNDLKEETATLKLEPTSWGEATHVQISFLPQNRKAVRAAEKEMKEIFRASAIQGQALTQFELEQQLGVKAGLSSDQVLAVALFNASKIDLLELTPVSQLTSDDQKKLAAGGANSDVIYCRNAPLATEAKARIAQIVDVASDACVLAKMYSIGFKYKVANRPVSAATGLQSSAVEFKDVQNKTDLVAISADQVPLAHERNALPQSEYSISVAATRGKEYYFRRTLQESPNTFSYTFAGSSGGLDIVKFKFTANTLEVVRARPIVNAGGTTSTDNDRILIFPVARYYKLLNTDEQGQPLAIPRVVNTTYDDPAALALVPFYANQLSNANSPLEYYGLEQCFQSKNDIQVLGIDNRFAKEGILNFTQESTYQASSSVDCANLYMAGYFDTVQTAFTFRERFSFAPVAPAANETPLFSLPFEAQKKLGFGIFTGSKKQPDHLGNTGTTKTEIPLGWVYNLNQGKQVPYVLAGLPTDNAELRKRMIVATKEVIADLNVAFKKALAGTPLESKFPGDVVTLTIEGSEAEEGLQPTPPMTLGDLERNYIYYIQKATEARVIGLGGSHASPRTGEVVAASVFIYGGNIVANVESMKKLERAQAEFEQLWDGVFIPEAQPSDGEASGQPTVSAAGAPAAALQGAAALAELGQSLGLKAAHSSKLQAKRGVKASAVSRSASKLKAIANAKSLALPAMSKEKVDLVISRLPLKDRAFMAAVEEAKRKGSLSNVREFDTIYLEKQIQYLGSSLKPQQLEQLQGTLARQKAVKQLLAKMRKANICVFEQGDVASMVKGQPDASELDLAVQVYKATLAHELGHNFGLRHNFIGSYDKDNWLFADEQAGVSEREAVIAKLQESIEKLPVEQREGNADVAKLAEAEQELAAFKQAKAKRDYSSIMDYLKDDHNTYSGFGPQDVAALRAAYTGYIELHPDVAPQLPQYKNGLIPLADYAKLTGIRDWINDLTSDKTERVLPIRKYRFCSDEDAGQSPTCRRFDKGASPSEIIADEIMDYRSRYSVANFPGDRLSFEWYQNGSYIGRLFDQMLTMRMFLEESFYRYFFGLDQVNEHLNGAREALAFLDEVIRTPDAPASSTGISRWKIFDQKFPGQGQVKARVERKQLSDELQDERQENADSRLAVRGIEFDKVIALIVLTERNFGFARYEQKGLRLSYPMFDQLFDGWMADAEQREPTPVDQLDSIKVLREVMTDTLRPAARLKIRNVGVLTLPLDGSFASSTTEMMRVYAMLGAISSLDVSGAELASNFSSLFRMDTAKAPPQGVPYIADTAANGARAQSQKYFPVDQALVSHAMIENATVIDWVSLSNVPELIAPWKAARAAGQATAEIEAKIDAKLAALPDAVGPKQMAVYARFIPGVEGFAAGVVEERMKLRSAQPRTPQERAEIAARLLAIEDQIRGMQNQLAAFAQANPVLEPILVHGILRPEVKEEDATMTDAEKAQNAFNSEVVEIIDRILPEGVTARVRSTTFGSASDLSMYFNILHQELQD